MSGATGAERLQAAEDLAREGRVAHAVRACHDILSGDPDDATALSLLGSLMLGEDFYDQAIVHATKAIECDPSCSPAYLVLGLAYDRMGGMWDRSILVWDELAEVEPDLVVAHVQLGEALDAADFEDQAIEAWMKALELDPGQARAMYDMALAALGKEGVATALPGFRRAGELDPSQDDLFFDLTGIDVDGPPLERLAAGDRHGLYETAVRFAREERFMEVAELVRRLLDEDPDDADVLALASYAFIKQEAVNEAMAAASRALALCPECASALYCLGVAYSRRPGHGTYVARVFATLARAAPWHPLPHVLLAEALVGLQRYAQAKRSYRTAVGLDPTCVRARFGLAAMYLTEGRWAESRWERRRAAYYDTRRQGTFWRLWDSYREGE